MNIKLSKILVYGTGRIQKDFEYMFDKLKIEGYITNDKTLQSYNNKKCYNFENINKKGLKKLKIIVCERNDENLKVEFEEKGFKYKKDFLFVEDLAHLLNDKIDEFGEKILRKYFKSRNTTLDNTYITNEELFKKMIYTDSSEGSFCNEPFRYAHIQPYGYVYGCCPSYGYNKIGNILFKSPKKVWNSNAAKLQRLAIINKTFAFCDDKLCPFRNLNQREQKCSTRFDNIKLEKAPNHVYVAIDESCNLKCKSCRKEYFSATGMGLKLRKFLAFKIINSNWASMPERFVLAGQGEVFYSKVYQKMLYSPKLTKRIHIEILTNGNLLTKDKLDKLCNTYKKVSLCVSIDAATAQTYNKIRSGGNFKKLLENLEYIGKMRRDDKIKNLELLFVVQRDNYKEIVSFIKMSKKYSADRVSFSQITNWGTFTDEEFEKISMVDNHGKPKKELKLVLDNKIFKQCKNIADTSNILKLVDEE